MASEIGQKKLGLGMLAGVSTGVFWGIPFLVPQMAPQFSPLEIAFGRFFFFGVVSALFLPRVVRILRGFSLKDLLNVFALSASGFWFYSMLLFWGVQETDGVISSLIIGLLPISIPLFSPGRKRGGFQFYFGLALLFLGLTNLFLVPMLNGTKHLRPPSVVGVTSLVLCLVLWTWFAIQNSRFLKEHSDIPRKDFASVIGVISLLSIAPFFLVRVNLAEWIHREGFQIYLLGSIALGLGSSWLANWLWNICSFHCPSEVSGPLIVSETVFGLIYSFAFEKRNPHAYEAVSICLFMFGVILTVRSQLREK